jgi:sugar phosphate isomerase/epimerase
MTDHDRELLDKIAAEVEHAESTRDVDLDYRRRRAPGGSRVYGLRLPADRIEQLRRLAEARGVEPSALARQWVLAQLDAAERRRDDAQERWERDLRETAEHLRHLLDERPGA